MAPKRFGGVGHHHMSFRPTPNHVYPNKTLILSGYLGCAPLFPMIAISLWTLAAFHQLHHSCPWFSIQAAAKTLCFLHHLKRDGPDWRLKNQCPACSYKLEDEPHLQFSWLVSVDGNNSLKRWDPSTYGCTTHKDSQSPHSNIWLPADVVDNFTGNEVQVRLDFFAFILNLMFSCRSMAQMILPMSGLTRSQRNSQFV
ncbi:hypothetical protein JVU11DRAFT_9219 [Chiua virens]|nr:hypothetical protein JVU11DRAFT_9219 [Chiua virens]